ncbi:ribulose-phosphate 3-epimerase [soil metagenome]
MARVEVAASILSADFGNLYRVVRKLERAGVDRLHLDVMDGHFVPNITFGPDIVAAVRRLTSLPIDVHLMISEPSRYATEFLEAGADTLTFHVEVDEPDQQKRETLARIRSERRVAGLAVSPQTDVQRVSPFLDELGLIMIMTVQPGFGGQRFMADAARKITEARSLLADRPAARVHVDGGVSGETAAIVGRHGAHVCVVGSALFQRGRDTAREVDKVRRLAAAPPRVTVGS